MSAWPLVVARLVDALPSLDGWGDVTVFDGPPVTGASPTAYCTVGYVVSDEVGGSYERDRGLGDIPQESGTVRCELVCKTGVVDVASVRTRAFAYVDTCQAWIDLDPTLGVLKSGSTTDLAVDVEPVQNQAGAAVRVVLSVTYLARL